MNNKMFNKEDLRNGMVVELVNGERRLIFNGKLINNNGVVFNSLDNYKNNMTITGSVCSISISKVFKFNEDFLCLTEIWERR
ncbi:hypothetical protein ACRTAL_002343 [Clostridium perfringens]